MNKLIQTLLISIFMILAVPALAQAQPLLLRTADSSEVYYVNTKLGLKKPMLSERVFKSYNNSWSWVKVVPKSEIDRYSDIRLVKLPDSPAIYYISGVTRQLVPTEQVFIANGFRWNEVVTVNYIDLSSYRLIEPLKARGARTSTKTSTSTPAKITVSAASAPKDDDRTVPADAEFTAHSINLKNTGRSDAHIKSIKLDVLGLDANAQSVGNIFIADANGNKIAGPFKTGVYGVTDIKLGTPITVPAGVNLNLKFITSGNTPGMYIALRVTDISYVETDAAVSAKKFPVTGNYYRIVDEPLVYNHTRAVTVQITPIRREITAGSRNLDVTKILLYEKTGDADVYLNKLTLTIIGEQPDAWVRNLKLVDANNRVVGSVSRVKNGIATFTFKKGLLIPAKGRQSLTLKVDFTAGEGHEVDFRIRRPEDVVMTTRVNNTTGHVVASLVSQSGPTNNAIKVVKGNALMTVNTVRPEQRYNTKEIPLASFDIKAQDKKRELVFTGLNLKIDNYGPNRAITSIIVKDGNTVVFEEKVKAYWGITGTITFKKPIYISTKSHRFQVIAVMSPKASPGDNFKGTVTDFKFVSADGFRDGANWHVAGPKIMLTGQKPTATTNCPNNSTVCK